MSQKASSYISADTPQMRYKKALLQIQKIHNANKMLKEQAEDARHKMMIDITNLRSHCSHLEVSNEALKKEKYQVEKALQQLQERHNDLEREYHKLQNKLDTELHYLEVAVAEKDRQLLKMRATGDEKVLAELINSYQLKEKSYQSELNKQENLIAALKENIVILDDDILEEIRQKQKAQDQLAIVRQQTIRYKELNNALIQRNENILKNLVGQDSQGKHREMEQLINEFTKQLEILKANKVEQYSQTKNIVAADTYEMVLQEKSRLAQELMTLKGMYDEAQEKIRTMYDLEEQLKSAVFKAGQCVEECNMLKGRLVVLETKELLDGSVDDQLKELEEKVLANIGNNDPLNAIKNGSDSSHFAIMKGFISEMKQKLNKAHAQQANYERKYRSIKEKFTSNAEKLLKSEQCNKLLRGKVEGYERLTEKLQHELQRTMASHEQQINRVKDLATSIVVKRTEESKMVNMMITAQIQLEADKAEKAEKNFRQEIQALQLELGAEKLKSKDLEDRLTQAQEFAGIFKKKFTELSATVQATECENSANSQNLARYEQMYNEEKVKSEIYLVQKQALASKMNALSEELEKRKYQFDEQSKVKDAVHEADIRKLKAELQKVNERLDQVSTHNKQLKKQLDQSTITNTKTAETVTNPNSYSVDLEKHYQEQREKCKRLEGEINMMRVRFDRLTQNSDKLNSLEEEVISKNDEINDLKRKIISMEKMSGVMELELQETKNQVELAKKENGSLRIKLLEAGQDVKRDYNNKDLENKKIINKLNEDLAAIASEIRDEKKSNSRLQNQLINQKSETARLEEYIEVQRQREGALNEELADLKANYDTVCDQAERIKSELKYKLNTLQSLNSELVAMQAKMFKLNQQFMDIRSRMQTMEDEKSESNRQLNNLKIYLPQAEDFIARLKATPNSNWQQQRERDNLGTLVQKVKKMLKTNDITAANENTFNTASFGFGGVQYQAMVKNDISPIVKTILKTDSLQPYDFASYGRFYGSNSPHNKSVSVNSPRGD